MQSSRSALIALIALSAAGCFSDRGIAIEIDVGATGATSVELYVGNSLCSAHNDAVIACDRGIAPPMARSHLSGTVWFRDDVVPYIAAVKNHKATFRLQASKDTGLAIAIAVGTQGPGTSVTGTVTLNGVVVPANDGLVLAATLVAAGDVVADASHGTEDRAQVWDEPQDGGSSCLLVEHWVNGKATRVFIVPADDPDCDHVANECDAAAWHGTIPSIGSNATPDCFIGGGQPCKLGAFGCSDDMPGPRTCVATQDEICAPQRFCDACAQPQSTADNMCAQGQLVTSADLVPYIDCTIGVALSQACPGESATLSLDDHFHDADCGSPTLSSLRFGGQSGNFGGTEIDVSNVSHPCSFSVRVKNGSHSVIPQANTDYGAITLSARGSSVILPVIFHFVPSACADQPTFCQFRDVVGDSMWTCLP